MAGRLRRSCCDWGRGFTNDLFTNAVLRTHAPGHLRIAFGAGANLAGIRGDLAGSHNVIENPDMGGLFHLEHRRRDRADSRVTPLGAMEKNGDTEGQRVMRFELTTFTLAT